MNLATISIFFIILGIVSSLIITIDIVLHPQKDMPIMNLVWPINGLWGGPFIVWAYFTLGKHRSMKNMDMSSMNNMKDMKSMDMSSMKDMKDMDSMTMDTKPSNNSRSSDKYSHYWQGIIVDTLHCGAGCTLSDLIGPWIFLLVPFTLFGSLTFAEWTLDYLLALLIGATFQYAAIAPMSKTSSPKTWVKALKIDFFSLTSWQVGMYGWMAIVIFVLFGRLSVFHPEFWFMMQIAMCLGFITAYPMNWYLVKKGIKMGM